MVPTVVNRESGSKRTEMLIASGQHQVAQQRELIVELEANGRSAAHAKYLLAGLELLQAARRDSRDWLMKQLDKVAR